MFPKEKRFSFKNGSLSKAIPSSSFTLKYGTNEEGLKIAVVVSKRVDKRAVVRNRIKRQILEIVQKLIKKDISLNLVFYVKQAALTSKVLAEEIKVALEQAK